MKKTICSALLFLGVVLLVLGFVNADSIQSGFSRLFTGEPTDKAIWFLILGGVALILGTGGMLRGSK